MKKILKLSLFALLLSIFALAPKLVGTSFAQTATQSIRQIAQANDSLETDLNEASESSTTSNLKERIEKIVEEKKDQLEATISEIAIQKKGYVGEVIRVTKETLTIESRGSTVIIPFEENLSLIKNKKAINLDDIAVGDFVTVIGTQEDDNITPERVIVGDENLIPKPKLADLGTIKTVSSKSITITSRDDQSEKEFTLNTKTKYFDLEGAEIEKSLLSEDIQCLIAGYEDEDSEYVATTIKVLTTAEVLSETEE